MTMDPEILGARHYFKELSAYGRENCLYPREPSWGPSGTEIQLDQKGKKQKLDILPTPGPEMMSVIIFY